MLGTPRGAYTTILIQENYVAVNWEGHVERLIKSLAALHSALDACYQAYYEHIQVRINELLNSI